MLIRSSQLETAIIGIVLPREFNRLLASLEERQREKEDAVAKADFERAVELRRVTDEIKSQLAQFVVPSIELLPSHIIDAITDLGYSDPIAV